MMVSSSLWKEPDVVIKVFLTMLALKGSDHVYRGSAFNLADQSKKTEIEVLDALKVLSSPDKIRIEKQPFDGRRIKAVEHGWLILNGRKYQEMMSEEMRLARLRRGQAAHRARVKAKKNGLTFLPGEHTAERVLNETGEDHVPHEFSTGKNSATFDPGSERGTDPVGEDPESVIDR